MTAIDVSTAFGTADGFGGYHDASVAAPRRGSVLASVAFLLVAAPALVVLALAARLKAAIVGEPAD